MTADSNAAVSLTPTGDPWLLTPGPLTTSPEVKQAMLHDYGSRDGTFIATNARIRERLVSIIGGGNDYVCVPLQGSGTFVVEAMLGSFVPRDGKLLLLINGAYGHRMHKIAAYQDLTAEVMEWAENELVDPAAVDARLAADPAITHVAVVHCETTSGILNTLAEVGAVVKRHGRGLLIDAMSAFGAIPLTAAEVPFDAVVASSNKCLEGVPGVGFCLARRSALEITECNATSLSLDLFDQWVQMEKTKQRRFTPPTHALLAFDRAFEEFEAEGGVAGRNRRYAENCRVLVEGMREMGFETLLPDRLQAPIIVTFRTPADHNFVFEDFYAAIRDRGFVIYPGKLTVADSVRIGCIGRLGVDEIRRALAVIADALAAMNVTNCAPAASAA